MATDEQLNAADQTQPDAGQGDVPEALIAEAEAAPDLTAAAVEAIPPEIVAQSVGEYLRAWWARVIGGDAGVLPVVVALVLVGVVFSILNKNFLTPGNLVNLFDQSAVFIVLAMGEGFALLLGEIDLSIGCTRGIFRFIALLHRREQLPLHGVQSFPHGPAQHDKS